MTTCFYHDHYHNHAQTPGSGAVGREISLNRTISLKQKLVLGECQNCGECQKLDFPTISLNNE